MLFLGGFMAIAILLTSIFTTLCLYSDLSDEVKDEIREEAVSLEKQVDLTDFSVLISLPVTPGYVYSLISPLDELIYDSRFEGTPGAPSTPIISCPEIQEAKTLGTGDDIRSSSDLRCDNYYYAILLEDGSIFRVSHELPSAYASYDQIFTMIFLLLVIGLVTANFASKYLSKKIAAPLNDINLEAPHHSKIYDEFAPFLSKLQSQRKATLQQRESIVRQRLEFTTIIENMNEGIFITDSDGTILSYNKSGVKLINSSIINPTGLHIFGLQRSESFRNGVNKAILENCSSECIIPIAGRECQFFFSPVNNETVLHGIIILILDVTEKQQHEQLRREFTSNVSHELKTPLTVISGYAEIMMNGMVAPPDVPEFSQSIYGECQRLVALVQDMLFLSKLDESTPPPTEPVYIRSACENVYERLKSKAEKAGISVSIQGEDREIQAIPSILSEILYNLLDNAIKYSRPHDRVTMTVREDSDNLVLTVRDTGIGIPKEDLPRIFQRFYRVDKSHNKSIEGTGLGLAIVKHGMMLHKGDIAVDSDTSGTVFTLTFPLDN